MNVLVCCADYPNLDGKKAMAFVHTRNLYYIQNGIDVTVLNFSVNNSYIIDGIKVISENDYLRDMGKKYEILICHSANLRNHYRFLIKNEDKFERILFFFHGHEVLKLNETYPKDYFYIKKSSVFKILMQNIYDNCKFILWKNYFNKIIEKSEFIFVSEWMEKMFFHNIKMQENIAKEKIHVIYNCVGEEFLKNTYIMPDNCKYDFITIRGNLDGSKYCIDIVTDLAENYPEYTFLIIGAGQYFLYNKMPANVHWINKQLSHKEMINMMDNAKYGLMPTRLDAQGVSMCEMATFGMPLVTSDIDVCQEVLGEFKNVVFVDNNNVDLKTALSELRECNLNEKNLKFSEKNTIAKEIALMFNK